MIPALLILLATAAAPQEPPAAPPERRDPIPETTELLEADPFLLPIDVLLDRAERMLDRTNRESAERAAELYRFALKIDPNSALAHAGTARTMTVWYLRRWKEDDALIDQAVAEGRKAVSLDGNDARTHAALAYALMAAEGGEEIHSEADAAWALRTESTPTWVMAVYAQSLLARDDREGALKIADEALLKRPDRAQLHSLRAQVLIEMKNYPEALLSLRRAYLLEPDYAPALLRMAWVYDRLGNNKRSADIFKRVTTKFPEEKARGYMLMASSLMQRKQYARALTGLTQVEFKTDRGLGEGTRLYLIALCQEKMGQVDQAKESYRKVIHDHPLSSFGSFSGRSVPVAAYEALARIALDQDQLPEAARLLEEAIELPHPKIDLFVKLAHVYEEHHLDDDARSILARGAGTDFGPGTAGPKMEILVAWARSVRRDPKGSSPERFAPVLEALRAETQALLATENWSWYIEAARACALLDAPDEGITWLRRAVEKGYDHLDWIRQDDEMKPLSLDKGFADLQRSAAGS
ncbi:MAG TPA: tetratricopeptide repeat protein [Candidatus Saccharimonadales bacterium]|nr:tetratricopeptide repeat protein [Candidatus Saccharimonadales bacterium]